mmetsp:Transcript_18216/g.45545  ORF Transcript_18216/g.45545 Transcript_18216/m.45545 type:complete len:211 (-) Transcript_18216:136-768(-)
MVERGRLHEDHKRYQQHHRTCAGGGTGGFGTRALFVASGPRRPQAGQEPCCFGGFILVIILHQIFIVPARLLIIQQFLVDVFIVLLVVLLVQHLRSRRQMMSHLFFEKICREVVGIETTGRGILVAGRGRACSCVGARCGKTFERHGGRCRCRGTHPEAAVRKENNAHEREPNAQLLSPAHEGVHRRTLSGLVVALLLRRAHHLKSMLGL